MTFATPQSATPPPIALNSFASRSSSVPVEASGLANGDCLSITYHGTRFSAVIPKILKLARQAGHWNRGLAQYERVLRTFAWITGDKPLGDYNHADVAKFKNAMLDMPSDYRPAKDFYRPFDEVVKTLKLTNDNKRFVNTIKRDLSYLSTAYEILAED